MNHDFTYHFTNGETVTFTGRINPSTKDGNFVTITEKDMGLDGGDGVVVSINLAHVTWCEKCEASR